MQLVSKTDSTKKKKKRERIFESKQRQLSKQPPWRASTPIEKIRLCSPDLKNSRDTSKKKKNKKKTKKSPRGPPAIFGGKFNQLYY